MKKLKIGINGFGRIGRNATRIILSRKDVELVAINSRAEISSHAYLLKYDSSYGILPVKVSVLDNYLLAGNNKINVFNIDNPAEIPWKKAAVDIVIDATGKFRTSADLKGHLKGGAKYVVLSAPAKDNIKTLVYGVNEKTFDPETDRIVSNSSCTTNCLTTTLKVLHEKFRVRRGFMTTVHSVTDSQNLLDNSHKKEVRLRRSAFASMIPSSTGSAKDVGKLFPDLAGKIICQSLRIPLLTVSLVNLTVELEQMTNREGINKEYEIAEKSYLKNILSVAQDELVSKDYTGNPNSSVVDTYLTQVSGGNLANIYAWYDNEWGYTNRLVDMASFVGRKAGLV